MMKSRESKMLGRVRRWRKRVYEVEKTRPATGRAKDVERLAQKLNLPSIQTGVTHKQ